MTRATKYSGVEWIGQIPERWHLTRIAGLYNLRNTKVSDKDFPALSVTNKGILPQLETAAKTNAGDNRKLVCIGDFAINSRSDRRGSCGISPYNGSVSLINLVLTPRSKTIPKYFDWLFHTVQFADEFYRWGHGIVDDLWSTGWEEMKKILVPLPPLPEQQAIADYLDDKCAQIDNITATINEQLEVLKQYKKSVITEAVTKGLDPNSPMKDSGVEWIGQIPEKWSISKMYLIADYKKGPFGSAITKNMFIDPTEEKAYKVYEQKNAIKKSADIGYYYISEEKFLSLKEFSIKPKDIIVSCAGTIGECFLLPEKCEEGIINQALMRIRLSKNIVSQYFLYLFSNSLDYLSEKYSNGSAIKNIPPFIILKKAKIPFPPLPEQQAIADYLDDKCAQIDAVIADKHAQLETLAAYKKSLIYEYVTGKKSVPGFEEA